MIHQLSKHEQEKLRKAIEVALRVPFIAGIEGFVLESIFHYVKGLQPPDPHSTQRKKLLFDAVDTKKGIGWSLKSHQGVPHPNKVFEVVIARADILDKKAALGFPDLSLDSDPAILGSAILKHWLGKFQNDKGIQKVKRPRIAILVKSRNHRRYALIEQDLQPLDADAIRWTWTHNARKGLQGKRQDNGQVVYRWYANQKQLFESFTLTPQAFFFEVNIHRIAPEAFMAIPNLFAQE